jgi:hypothetical protein
LALQEYLSNLYTVLVVYQPILPVQLWVLAEGDWRAKLRQPYGFPFQTSAAESSLFPTQNKVDSQAAVYGARFYPDRLLWRLREVLLPAAKAVGGLPSSIPEFIDLSLGREYARAVGSNWKLRTRAKATDEAIASYIFLLALHSVYPELYGKALRWATLLGQLIPSDPEDQEGKKGYTDQLWFQGQALARAAGWVEASGDGPLKELLAAAPLSKKGGVKLMKGFDPPAPPPHPSSAQSAHPPAPNNGRGVGVAKPNR